jgi:hypothetical protein
MKHKDFRDLLKSIDEAKAIHTFKNMPNCCKDFWEINGLQGDLNEPMKYCAYCGRKLTKEEFNLLNKRLGQKTKIPVRIK